MPGQIFDSSDDSEGDGLAASKESPKFVSPTESSDEAESDQEQLENNQSENKVPPSHLPFHNRCRKQMQVKKKCSLLFP